MNRSITVASPHRADVWAAGEAYEPYVGRWSRLVAREFIDWLGLPSGDHWLDVGCGTGALTQTIAARSKPASVTGLDPSDRFIAYARRQTHDRRVRFQTGDAQALPFPDMMFDAVVAGLVLNFIPNPARAVAEMKRVLRAGGTGAVYVWDHAGEMQLTRYFWSAAVALDPEAQRSTRRGGFRSATGAGCSPCSRIAASTERNVASSMCPQCSRISKTIGRRSSADKARLRPIAARSPMTDRQCCANASGRRCRSNATVRFI
jgi:SAM-dependent methyltransferase